MPTTAQVGAAADAYVRALTTKDRDRWLGLFADDAVLVDPVPGPAVRGREGLGTAFDAATGSAEQLEVRAERVVICGAEAAVVFTTEARTGERGVAFDGVLLLTVDDHGRISSARSYWEPGQLRAIG